MQLTIRSGPDAGKTINIQGEQFMVGREPGNDLVLNDTKVSRRHASLKALPDGRVALQDLGSANGTFVNGQRIQSALLHGNEQVQFGDTMCSASDGAAAAAAPPVG